MTNEGFKYFEKFMATSLAGTVGAATILGYYDQHHAIKPELPVASHTQSNSYTATIGQST